MKENYKLAKYLNDEMTDEELKEFQSESDYHLYQKIKLYSSELETTNFDEEKILSKVIATKNQAPKVITLKQNWFLRIAAVLVIGLGLYFSYNTFSSSNELAANGLKTTFTLPDNSEVVLNSGSEINYKKWNWDSNRNLNLKGEAYFKVAKGKKFEVKTDLGTVSVLGTQFDVKARKNRFDVTCFEGRVKVNYNKQEVILTKGQTVSFENNNKILFENVTETKPLWTSAEINFNKENLSNIIDEIERQYNITINLNTVKNEQLYTGKLPTNNLDVALETISSIYHLKHSKTDKSNYIFEEIK